MPAVRPARRADDDALAEIDRLTWSPDVSPVAAPAADAAFFGATGPDPADVLVATSDDGRVLGYVRLDRGFPIPAHDHVLQINGLGVHPQAAGRGVGTALVTAAVAAARDRGARRLTLRVLGPNVAAQRLYTRCGFVVEGVLRGEFHIAGRDVDDVLMAHHLAVGTTPPTTA